MYKHTRLKNTIRTIFLLTFFYLFPLDFQEAFGLFDRDSDGYVTSDEVGVVIRSLGGIVTDAEIKELVKQFEESKSYNQTDSSKVVSVVQLENGS